MKKFFQDFKAFALRGNVLDMAIGIIIGTGIAGLVSSLTDNFINPILQICTFQGWFTFNQWVGFFSSFLSAVVEFVVLAFVLFLLVQLINKLINIRKKKEEEAPVTTKVCPYCLSEIPLAATRCAHCTSEQPTEDKAE